MRKVLIALLSIMALTALIPNAHAENLVKIRLLAERTNVSAGDEIWVGIEESIEPHWHTYWQNPGDSGTITKADWTLPEGFEIAPIQWPTPKQLPYGPLMNYGYENNVVLLQKLKLPETLPEGVITLTADIELLVCKEECIPEYGEYTLKLNDPNSLQEDNTVFFENAVSKLPIAVDWNAEFHQNEKSFKLNIDLPREIAQTIKSETLAFYPIDWGLIENAQPQSVLLDDTKLTFTQSKGERDFTELETSQFVIAYENQDGLQNSFVLEANAQLPLTETIETTVEEALDVDENNDIPVAQALIFALLGGLILNLMPCVFPVLSIKALSLVKIADKEPALARAHGIAYTAGVILSFVAIAAILLALKSAGAQIGWGFQLQNPLIVGALTYLLFIIGLNLSGYFEFGNNFGNVGNKLTQGHNLNSSFFTGVLATLVATPCTAPLMAGAIGFALTQSAIVNLTIFAALGLGLALPYLALSFVPSLQKTLPKPGPWMETFKQFLAFPMFAAAIWLVWVLSKQAGPTGVLQILSGMGLIAFGLWLIAKAKNKVILKFMAIITFVLAGLMLIMPTAKMQNTLSDSEQKQEFGEVFTKAKLDQILNNTNEPVFVEMTAAWCITCKLNHAVAINIPSTKKAFAENNVRYLIGDWTNQDPEITQYLNSFGRNGVPIYVYYAPRQDEAETRPKAKVLPQILTPGTIPAIFKKEK